MLLDRFRSLEKKLLTRTGPDGAAAAPLRAYGKLELAAEYLDVGCDEQPGARQFRAWINDGCNYLVARLRGEALRLRQHRLLASLDGGRVWVVACLWHSGDRRSEHGSQRHFPFVLFTLVPAPVRKHALAAAAAICEPIWTQLEQMHAPLQEARDRGECIRVIRQQTVAVSGQADPLAVAEAIPMAVWLAGLTAGAGSGEALLEALAQRATTFRQSKGRHAAVWRLPLARGLDAAPQLAAWWSWLDGNLDHRGDFGCLAAVEPLEECLECAVIFRGLQVQDFGAFSGFPQLVDQALGPGLRTTAGSSGQQAQLDWRGDSLAAFARWRV